MKKRAMSLLLVLLMVVTLFPTFAAAAEPVDYGANGVITNPDPETDESGKLNLTKALAPGANGTYDITMESWATGEVKTQGITEKIPTDFVLVVDQSGSMDTTDMPTGDPTVRNNKYLEDIANGAYYYKDGDNYYRVYGVKDYLFRYYPANYWWTGSVIQHLGTSLSWFMGEEEATTNFNNAFYFREEVNGVTYYEPIRTTVEGKVGAYVMYFSYPSKATNGTFEFKRDDTTYSTNGNSPWYHKASNGQMTNSGLDWRTLNASFNTFYPPRNQYVYGEIGIVRWGMYINYPMYDRHVGYTKLCYRDVNGVEHEVASNQNGGQTTWEFCDGNEYAITAQEGSRPTYSGLYTFPNTGRRIDALQTALTEFAQAVANETDDFGAVDNRVSIIGFSSDENTYKNTELLTGTTFDITRGSLIDSRYGYSADGYNHNGKMKSDATAADYAGALVSASSGSAGTVNSEINDAIGAITAYGGTQPEDGLNMAYQVLTNRSNTTYTIRSGEHKDETVDRNTVVIFFTDGQPGNYKYSDQYSEANEVVAQAKQIKDYGKTLDYGTTIFSIGVFGESDGNPLTYDGKNDWVENPSAQGQMIRVRDLPSTSYWQYLGGWVETYTESGTNYCLRRQWRPNNVEGYTAEPNDTIYDYMSVVSSNYPDAKNFIAPTWLTGGFSGNYIAATDGDAVRQKSTAEATNKYYRMASNQDTLIAAFLQAVTMNNEEITSDTSVPLNETAIFKDKVNLADFDTTGATYTVKWQPVKEENGQLVNNGNAETKVNGAAYPADGINYSGFNYSANFVTSAHPGQKLVITINGLTPKKTVGELKSNDGNAGVYGPEDEDPTVSITSPTLQFPESAAKTYVIDFNAKMTVATETTKLVGATNDTVTGTNGSFVKSGTNVTYQLSSGNQAGKTAEINKAYTGVDTATVYGKLVNVENAKLGWNQITTVPASSVYYDDSFTEENAQVLNYPGDVVAQTGTFDGSNSHIFTFYGTGIDVYCTTHDNGGYVSAALYQGSSTTGTPYKVITVKNQSKGDYFNTPTVHFTDLEPAQYTVWLYANSGAQYKIDGVRVYNPVKATDNGEPTKAAEELALTDEANALYFNLHDLLLNASSDYSAISKDQYENLEDADAKAVSGVLYLDNAANICLQSNDAQGNAQLMYESDFDLYKTNSPINEIYLQTTNGQPQGVAFKLNTWTTGEKAYLGVSAPKGSGKVLINGKELPVTSSVDQYYDITEYITNGVVSIKTDKNDANLVSVTNLKITHVDPGQVIGQNPTPDATDGRNAARRLAFAPMTTATVEEIAQQTVPELFAAEPENPGTPDTPETPDQPDDPTPGAAGSVQEMLKQLFESLMKNLFGLFKGLGNW